jgi:hypothetical protein
MATHTSRVLPVFDFSEPLRMTLTERFDLCLTHARKLAAAYQRISDYPCVSEHGALESELKRVESELGRPFPSEYRMFLSRCRYLKIDDGREIGGFDHEGLYVTEKPWVSNEHRKGVEYLVFANYWAYADGDQLLFDLSDPHYPVAAYLHEHGPLYEAYAPSFSLALWRLVHEFAERDEDEG